MHPVRCTWALQNDLSDLKGKFWCCTWKQCLLLFIICTPFETLGNNHVHEFQFLHKKICLSYNSFFYTHFEVDIYVKFGTAQLCCDLRGQHQPLGESQGLRTLTLFAKQIFFHLSNRCFRFSISLCHMQLKDMLRKSDQSNLKSRRAVGVSCTIFRGDSHVMWAQE